MFSRTLAPLRRLGGAFLILGFAAVGAHATVMLPLSIEDMSRESVAVVRARVVEQEARWGEDKKRIFTHTRLEVLDPIHRARAIPTLIEVRTLGGELDGLGMKVAGEARFAPGEQVVVFLAADRDSSELFRVVGMSQGKFRVHQEPEGRWVATPSVEGLAFAKRGTDGVLRVSDDPVAADRIPLEELRRRVLSALEPTAPSVHEPKTPTPSATP